MFWKHSFQCLLLVGVYFLGCSDISNSPSNSHQVLGTPPEEAPSKTKGNEKSKVKSMNTLAQSQSPYLLQHADNPVHWLEWGDQAFEKAKKEGKPVLLSIGYSTCHWCHVMAHESFEDKTVAEYINKHFIAIKVDREERPDVDRIYMTYVQATTGRGGWPMTVFLTPERVPFYGGTYFPKGRFLQLLGSVNQLWKTKPEELEDLGKQFTQYLQKQVAEQPRSDNSTLDPSPLLRKLVQELNQQYDEKYAGFGAAPKFPRPVILSPLIAFSQTNQNDPLSESSLNKTVSTLRAMAQGGMYDQVGGGFHRYSVDQYWHVPHFEKMLYDQGQLASVYAQTGMQLNEPFFIEIAEDICKYVQQRMTSPEGAFYSAEDADSLPEHGAHESKEGAFYVWKYRELVDALGEEEAKLCASFFGAKENGNVRPESDPLQEFVGENVFTRTPDIPQFASKNNLSEQDLKDKIAHWRKTLLSVRAQRPAPHLDDKILVAWNGLMISGFVQTYLATQKSTYLEGAEAAVSSIRSLCWDEENKILYRLHRGKRGTIRAFADDYALLIQALLDLHEASGSSNSLIWAIELQTIFDQRFSHSSGGWYETDGSDRLLLSRMQEAYEGAEPGSNSIAVRNCLRFSSLLGEESYREQADKAFQRYSPEMQQQAQGLPTMLSQFYLSAQEPPTIVITEGNGSDELRNVAHQYSIPGSTVLTLTDQTRDVIKAPWIQAMSSVDQTAQVFLCQGKTCKAPTTDKTIFQRQLEELKATQINNPILPNTSEEKTE